MNTPFTAVQITDRVYWVGAIDWAIRDFHGYSTSRGTTYNAYLVLADKITLIDTVKAPFKDELLSRIASVLDPGRIDYIVSNHSEMDHSGCLREVMGIVKPEKVFASQMGVKALSENLHIEGGIEAVKDGSSLSLGNMTLTFLETRMLHWPDSMIALLAEEDLLFSQDGFGMHLASTERFDDQIPKEIWTQEAAKYYANILLPYSPLILKLLERVGELGLSPKIIAPDHGPVFRQSPGEIVGLYGKWAAQKPTNKAVVTYDTMWQSTAVMARAIGDGLAAGGASPRLMPLGSSHRSDVATEILDAGALIVGSPTLNNNMFPTVADVLTYLKGLRPKNLVGAAFGSYGWGGEAPKQIAGVLAEMKIDLVGDPLRVKYVPDAQALSVCRALGTEIAQRLE